MAILLAQKSLVDHVAAVARALASDGLSGGRRAVALIVGRDVSELDEAGVARAAIESAAENFSDGVVAPAFWYALLGLPGLFVYKAVNTADSMIGHRSDAARGVRLGGGAARRSAQSRPGAALRPADRGAACGRSAATRRRGAPSRSATRRVTNRRMPAGRRRRLPARSASRSAGRAATASVAVDGAWLNAGGRREAGRRATSRRRSG